MAIKDMIAMWTRFEEIIENLVGVFGTPDQDLQWVMVVDPLKETGHSICMGTTPKFVAVAITCIVADFTFSRRECPCLKTTGILECIRNKQGVVVFVQWGRTPDRDVSMVLLVGGG
jgi:hypothetical protein